MDLSKLIGRSRKNRLTVGQFMSAQPYTIKMNETLSAAEELMAKRKIRHLPVTNEKGVLVGILSDRDIALLISFNADPKKTLVDEAYAPDPYKVSKDTPMDEVCDRMSTKKYGCAIVYDGNKLAGIFTWIDALDVLGHLLRRRPMPY